MYQTFYRNEHTHVHRDVVTSPCQILISMCVRCHITATTAAAQGEGQGDAVAGVAGEVYHVWEGEEIVADAIQPVLYAALHQCLDGEECQGGGADSKGRLAGGNGC